MSEGGKAQKITEAKFALTRAKDAIRDEPRQDRANPLWDTIDEIQDIVAGLLTALGSLIEAVEQDDRPTGPDLNALAKLGDLRDSDVLTDEEFAAQKARLLN
jgi:Short C-terminal domain